MPAPSVPIPQRMRRLKRDRRGYPIPAGVYVDDTGRPHFTINDEATRLDQIVRHCCPICGTRIKNKAEQVFVGGPQSAFHPQGAYIDLPMHPDCAAYALQVCPYLAAPHYNGRLDDRTLTAESGKVHIMLDNTVYANRPPTFVAVTCIQ